MYLTDNILDMVQSQLRSIYGPDHYYTTTYSRQEKGYWGSIPSWMLALQELTCNDYILDIGAAYGTLAMYASLISSASVAVFDADAYLSPEALSTYRIRRSFGDIERTDTLPIGLFSAVILTEVIEHFNFHPIKTLIKIRNTMRPDGILFLSTPDASSAWGRCGKYPSLASIGHYDPRFHTSIPREDTHIWQYTEAELLDVLAGSGFKIMKLAKSESPGGLHFNIMAQAVS